MSKTLHKIINEKIKLFYKTSNVVFLPKISYRIFVRFSQHGEPKNTTKDFPNFFIIFFKNRTYLPTPLPFFSCRPLLRTSPFRGGRPWRLGFSTGSYSKGRREKKTPEVTYIWHLPQRS
jgi:hypothetical protein